MSMLVASELAAGYSEGPLFSGLNFVLQPGDRLGIVGPNGSGKSTLLRVLSGQLQPDAGAVSTDSMVGFLEQTPKFNMPVSEYMDAASGGLLTMDRQLHELYGRMEEPGVAAQVGKLQEKFEARDGWNVTNRIDSFLDRLGAPADSMQKVFGELSGGEQSRVLLAGQLLREPDILLLDEPTNNLDEEALVWLEDYLSNYRGAVVVVSHDRTFLDNAVNSMIELDGSGGKPEIYDGGYTEYREQLAANLARLALGLEAQRKRVARIETAIAALAAKGARNEGRTANAFYRAKAAKVARRATVTARRLEKFRQSDGYLTEANQPPVLPWQLSGESKRGQRMVTVENATLGYGPNQPPILSDVSLTISGQEHVSIVGSNGAGKTTLLRAIAGETDLIQSGKVETHADYGYLSQTQVQAAAKRSPDNVLDWFRKHVGAIYEDEAAALLVWFGFGRHQLRQPVKKLSPGEISMLMLLGMTYSGKDLLLLDEPTNHLYFDSLDVVESVLKEYRGTLAVVSHDRSFLKNIGSDRRFKVADGRVQEVPVAY